MIELTLPCSLEDVFEWYVPLIQPINGILVIATPSWALPKLEREYAAQEAA